MSKVDDLFNALAADGAISGDRKRFDDFFFKPGDEGYQNRLTLYNALKADGAIQSPTYEDFMTRLGFKPASSNPAAAASRSPQKATGVQPAQADPVGQVTATQSKQTLPKQTQPQRPTQAQTQTKTQAQPTPTSQGASLKREGAFAPAVPVGRDSAKAGLMAAMNKARGVTDEPSPSKSVQSVTQKTATPSLQSAISSTHGGVPVQNYASSHQDGADTLYIKMRRGGEDFLVPQSEIREAGGFKAWADKNPGGKGLYRVYMEGKGFKGHVDLDEVDDHIENQGYKLTATTGEGQHKLMADRRLTNDINSVIDGLWSEAEAKTRMRANEVAEQSINNPWANTATSQGDIWRQQFQIETARQRNFDLDKMVNETIDRLSGGDSGQSGSGAPMSKAEQDSYKKFCDKVYRQVLDFAASKNAPKDAGDYVMRRILDSNLIMSLFRGAVRRTPGVNGSLADVEEETLGKYGEGRPVAELTGTVLGMTADPTMMIGGWAGKGASLLANKVGGKVLQKAIQWGASKGVSSPVATRLFGSTSFGRLTSALSGSVGNFATFEGVGEAARQFRHGEDFSAQKVVERAVHGAELGFLMGVGGHYIGNYGTKLTHATQGTIGKVGVRTGEFATSTMFNGTVFAWSGATEKEGGWRKWSNWDILGGMFTDLGFKAFHKMQTAPAQIASLMPVKYPRTMAEFNHNRQSFEEHVRRNLDGMRDVGLFTKEDIAELEKTGYGNFLELFEPAVPSTEKELAKRDQLIAAEGGRGPRFNFKDYDCYEAMKEFVKDEQVSEALRGKMYALLTGRGVIPSSVFGYTETTDDATGRITVTSQNAHDGAVTSKTFTSRRAADREIAEVKRQVELNNIHTGEQFFNSQAFCEDLENALREVFPGEELPVLVKRWNDYCNWDEAVRQAYGDDMKAVVTRLKVGTKAERAVDVCKRLSADLGVDVEGAIRKRPALRSELEQRAVEKYIDELFSNRTPEMEEADAVGEQLGNSFNDAHDNPPANTPQMSADADLLRSRLVASTSEDWVQALEADAPGTISGIKDPNLKQMAIEYATARAILDGAEMRHEAEIEAAVAEEEKTYGALTFRGEGARIQQENGEVTSPVGQVLKPIMIYSAATEGETQMVWVLSGKLAVNADGSLNRGETTDLVVSTIDGIVKMIGAKDVAQVLGEVSLEDMMATRREQIRQRYDELREQARSQETQGGAQVEAKPDEAPAQTETPAEPAVAPEVKPEAAPAVAEAPAQEQKTNEEAVEAPTPEAVEPPTPSAPAEPAAGPEPAVAPQAPTAEVKPEAPTAEVKPEAPTAEVKPEAAPAEPAPAPAPAEPATAMSRIPVDKNGKPQLDKAPDHGTAWDAINEKTGNPETSQAYVLGMIESAKKRVEKANQATTKHNDDLDAFAAADAKRRAEVAEAQRVLEFWEGVSKVDGMRKVEAEQAARQAKHQAELDRLEAERKAERDAERQRKAEEKADSPTKYAEAMEAWDEPKSLREYILRSILGGLKFKWNDTEGGPHGIARHLFGNRNSQSKNVKNDWGKMKWMVDEENGITPEQFAESLCQEFYNDYERDTDHYNEVFAEVLDVLSLGMHKEMWRELNEERERLSKEEEGLNNPNAMTEEEMEAEQDQLNRLAVDRTSEEKGAGGNGGALGREGETNNDGRGPEVRPEGSTEVRGDVRQASSADAEGEQAPGRRVGPEGEGARMSVGEETAPTREEASAPREEIISRLDKETRRAVEAVEAKGIKVHFYESDENDQGVYRDGEIWVNTNAKKSARFILGHELNHGVRDGFNGDRKAIDDYDQAAEMFARKQMGDKAYEGLIRRTKMAYKRFLMREAGYTREEVDQMVDDAYVREEVTGDIMGEILDDPNAARVFFTNIKDRSTLRKVYDAIVGFFNNMMGRMRHGSEEWKRMKDAAEKFAELYKQADRGAVAADAINQDARYSTSGGVRGAGGEFIFEETKDGKKVAKITIDGKVFDKEHPITVADLKAAKRSPLNYMLEDALECGTNKGVIESAYKAYASLMNVFLHYGGNEVVGMDSLMKTFLWIGDQASKPISTNSDAQYKLSQDITRICKKNEQMIKTLAVLARKQGHGVTPAQIIDTYLAIEKDEAGLQNPCGVCYVFSRYLNAGRFATGLKDAYLAYKDRLCDPSTMTEQEKADYAAKWFDGKGKLETELAKAEQREIYRIKVLAEKKRKSEERARKKAEKKGEEYIPAPEDEGDDLSATYIASLKPKEMTWAEKWKEMTWEDKYRAMWLVELSDAEAWKANNNSALTKARLNISRALTEIDVLGMQLTKAQKGEIEYTDTQIEARKQKIEVLSRLYMEGVALIGRAERAGIIKNAIFMRKKAGDESMLILRPGGERFWEEETEGGEGGRLYSFTPDVDVARQFPGYMGYRSSRGAGDGKIANGPADVTTGDFALGLGAASDHNTQFLNGVDFREAQTRNVNGDQITGENDFDNWYVKAANAKTEAEFNFYRKKARDTFKSAVTKTHKQNLLGGTRMWSWSDFIPSLGGDMVMLEVENAILGAAQQAYSKQTEGIELAGKFGSFINGSLIGKGKGYVEIPESEVIVVDGKNVWKEPQIIWDSKNGRVGKYYEPVTKDENGNWLKLEFDPKMGIRLWGLDKPGHSYKKGLYDLLQQYDTVNSVTVGMNDVHINLLLDSDIFDFVIPWHASGLSTHMMMQMYGAAGINLKELKGTDYTSVQSDGELKDGMSKAMAEFFERNNHDKEFDNGLGTIPTYTGKKYQLSKEQKEYRALRKAVMSGEVKEGTEEYRKVMADEFLREVYRCTTEQGLQMTSEDASHIYPYEYWDKNSTRDNAEVNGARYLEYCRRLGFSPKFCGMNSKGEVLGFGDFSKSKGFWKLLIDRRMYDRNKKYQDISPITIDKFEGADVDPEVMRQSHEITNLAQDSAIDRITDRVLSEEKRRLGQNLEMDFSRSSEDIIKAFKKAAEDDTAVNRRDRGKVKGAFAKIQSIDEKIKKAANKVDKIAAKREIRALYEERDAVLEEVNEVLQNTPRERREDWLNEKHSIDIDAEFSETELKDLRYRDVDNETQEKLESLPPEELVKVYRNVIILEDGRIASPMAVYNPRTGEIQVLKPGWWNGPSEREVVLTDDQLAKYEELKRTGRVIIDGKENMVELDGKTVKPGFEISPELKFVYVNEKDKSGKWVKGVKLKYALTRDNSVMWVDYNPYDHAVAVALNDQFKAAWRRPNLVVIEAVMPKAELESGYHAPYAVLPTGDHLWNTGRQLYLSRYSKILRIVPNAEVAKMIDQYWKENPDKYEKSAKSKDWDRFTPQVRMELEKLGRKFEYSENSEKSGKALEKAYDKDNAFYVTDADIETLNANFTHKWQELPQVESDRDLNRFDANPESISRRVNGLAERVGVKVRVVTDMAELDGATARQRKAKGWYDIKTGEVVIVAPNHLNVTDIENTFLHEVVGHKGLRKFIGEEKFNVALDNIYNHAGIKLKGYIDEFIPEDKREDRAAIREAVEEYLSDLAGRITERGFEEIEAEEQSMWKTACSKILELLNATLKSLGLKDSVEFSEKHMKYLLYKSWRNLKDNPEMDAMMREKSGYDADGEGRKYRFGSAMAEIKLEGEEREAVRGHAESVAREMGIEGDVSFVEGTEEGLTPDQMGAKAWMDPESGKVTVNLANAEGAADVEASLLHEGAGHKGLRAMFGEKFKQFLGNVWDAMPEELRRRAFEGARKYGWDLHTGTEEVLSEMAEKGEFKKYDKFFNRLKGFFGAMLRASGLRSGELSDNELQYVLWQSYRGLQGKNKGLIAKAERIAMEHALGVGRFSKKNNPNRGESAGVESTWAGGGEVGNPGRGDLGTAKVINNFGTASNEGVLFRRVTQHDQATVRDMYEKRIASSGFQVREAMQDSMLGLRVAMEEILGDKWTHIEDVPGYQNAYLAENRMTSEDNSQTALYEATKLRPLLEVVEQICGKNNYFQSRWYGKFAQWATNTRTGSQKRREALGDYMMAKHGLERNVILAERDAREAADLEVIEGRLAEPSSSAAAQAAYDAFYQSELQKNRARDYSGLTDLTGEQDLGAAEAAAQQMVTDYENYIGGAAARELWAKTKEATEASLTKLWQGGVISDEEYQKTLNMFNYYVPLRGWSATTSDDMYAYLSSPDGMLRGSVMKRAKGRSTKADDPIAYIAQMGDQAIREANRNAMKQRFLNFVLDHPSDLVSVNDMWLEKDVATGGWKVVAPTFTPGMTPEQIEQEQKAFEARMKAAKLAEPKRYKKGHDAVDIPYRVPTKGQLGEHQVIVKRNGVPYILTINGNPRAAQALNGLTNPDNSHHPVVDAIQWVNRKLSGMYTSYNLDFMLSNLARDVFFSGSMSWVKESPAYAASFHKNLGKCNPATMAWLFTKWNNGTLNRSKGGIEKMFYDFMVNGGETGYTNIKNIQQQKARIDELFDTGGLTSGLKGLIEHGNRSIENVARFAAFLTSMEHGRGIDRSIYDAKEVSVNFNKKGAGATMRGATGQTMAGNVAAWMSGTGRTMFAFWNAAVQGLINPIKQKRRHPVKLAGWSVGLMSLGLLVPLIGPYISDFVGNLIGGDDDEEDKKMKAEMDYYNIPEFVRRNNMVIRTGSKWTVIPLPVEARALYGTGEMMAGIMSGREKMTSGEIAWAIASQFSQLSPVDILEDAGSEDLRWHQALMRKFTPTALKPIEDLAIGYSWSGSPIAKRNEFNKNDPEYMRVYKNADPVLVETCKWLNSVSQKNKIEGVEDPYQIGSIDINPAELEYLASGYTGGVFRLVKQVANGAWNVAHGEDWGMKNIPVVNRFVKDNDERWQFGKIQREYWDLKKEVDITDHLFKNYKKDADKGVAGMAQLQDFIHNQPEFARSEIFRTREADMQEVRKKIKEATDPEEKKAYELAQYGIMNDVLTAIEEYEAGGLERMNPVARKELELQRKEEKKKEEVEKRKANKPQRPARQDSTLEYLEKRRNGEVDPGRKRKRD